MAAFNLSLPNLLTLSRIIVIPAVIATFYFKGDTARWIACGLFAFAGITDYFDGKLARSRGQVSKLGRFLDPIADKLLVASLLLMLASFDRLGTRVDIFSGVLPALIILCREILVSGLREFLAELQVEMPVTKLAKWKTTFQFFALPMLIVGDAAWEILHLQTLGIIFLWIAGILTAITGYDYLIAGLKHMRDEELSE